MSICKNEAFISGRLQSDSEQAIEGAYLEVIEDKSDTLLGETFSGEGGVFRTAIDLSRISDIPSKEREITVNIRDGKNRLIGQREALVLKPGQDFNDLFEINSHKLEGFVPAGTLPAKFSGPLNNRNAMHVIRDAVALIYEPGSPGYNQLVNGANCPLPPIFNHENIMDAATGAISGDAYARKELTDILELYADEEVGFETKLDKLVLDGFDQAEVDENERLTEHNKRGALLGKIGRKLGRGENIRLPEVPYSAGHTQVLSYNPGRVGYTPHPDGGLDLGNPCLIPDIRFQTLGTAILISAENPTHAARLMRGFEIGLCGLGRSKKILDAAHTAIQTNNPKHLHGLLRRSVAECGPDDGPPRDPFPDPDRGGCSPPFEDLPERCKPPVECMHEGARKLHGVFARGVNYHIDSISPSDACPGTQIRITGSDFGNHGGEVCFSHAPSLLAIPGVRGVCVSADSWSDTEILVTVPDDAPSGHVSLRIVERTDRFCGNIITVYRKGNAVEFEGGNTGVRLYLDQFRCMGPGETLKISWDANPSDASVDISIQEDGSNVKTWNDRNADGHINWTDPNSNSPRTLTVTATATGPCGSDSDTETVEVNVVPTLTITGLEVTQGIQTYNRTDGTPNNNLSTIANKDTIVRVYIDCDRNGFENDTLDDVTGILEVGGSTLSPINGQSPSDCSSWSGGNPFITARSGSAIDRTQTNHTLNFRIPAALSTGTKRLKATVTGPRICNEEPRDVFDMSWSWRTETSLKVRYVRIRNDNSATGSPDRPTDAEARCTINRNFDLLPSPPTDIGPARLATFNTNRNFQGGPDSDNNNIIDGLENLLADLDDEHDCNAWEWLTQWFGSDCPDPDNAYWVGLTGPFNRGLAGRPGNTCLSARYNPPTQGQSVLVRFKTAHELGHNLGLRHVNQVCSGTIGGPFDTLPNGGILLDVPFDPFWNMAIGGTVGDLMSYECARWTSGDAWGRLQSAI